MSSLLKKSRPALAEFVATTLYVYSGCGSVYSSAGDKLTIALAFGLSATSLAYTVGHVSGGHMNPIVTIAMCILGRLDIVSGFLYILAQLLGAMAAAALLNLGMISHSVSMAVNQINDENITFVGAYVMEAILSFLLVYVISETVVDTKNKAGNCAPIAIGVAVFMAHIVAIPFTGCSINPARSFGPAIISGDLNDLWVFVAAPLSGGVIASLIARFMFGVLDTTKKPKVVVSSDGQVQYDKLFTPTAAAAAAAAVATNGHYEVKRSEDFKLALPHFHVPALTFSAEDDASTPS